MPWIVLSDERTAFQTFSTILEPTSLSYVHGIYVCLFVINITQFAHSFYMNNADHSPTTVGSSLSPLEYVCGPLEGTEEENGKVFCTFYMYAIRVILSFRELKWDCLSYYFCHLSQQNWRQSSARKWFSQIQKGSSQSLWLSVCLTCKWNIVSLTVRGGTSLLFNNLNSHQEKIGLLKEK